MLRRGRALPRPPLPAAALGGPGAESVSASAPVPPLASSVASAAVPVVATLLAVVLLAAVATAGLRGSTASAPTVLLRGALVAASAQAAPQAVRAGDPVPRGAVLTAGSGGAVLRTRDRDTWLSAGAVARVLDGARQELQSGSAVVDARRGPGLVLSTGAAAVTATDGSLARVESGPLVRVGSYRGDVRVQPVGRRATARVDRDHQLQVPAGSLPGPVTPLVLTPGDAAERALVPELVAADEALAGFSSRLATGTWADAVQASFRTDVAAAPDPAAGAPAGDRALAYLVARATGGPLAARYAQVGGLRADGGSWGVIADLVGARVAQVSAQLDQLLAAPAALAAGTGTVDLGRVLGLLPTPEPSGAASQPAAPATAGPATSTSRTTAPASAPAPAPVPSRSPSPTPTALAGGALAPVTAAAGAVLDLIGVTPAPVPATTTTTTTGTTPAPVVGAVGGAVGGVVGTVGGVLGK